METKYLEGLGLDKEVINKIMAENGKDIESEKSKLKGIEAERDSVKTQLEETKTALKGFEGINVTELNTKIAELSTQLSQKETEYKEAQAKREFNDMLKAEITTNGGKSEKAILAMLDNDALLASKNQKDDIKKAIDALRTSDSYLFGETEPVRNPTQPISNPPTPDAKDASMRSAMGLPPITK